jgi:hypothetical protein
MHVPSASRRTGQPAGAGGRSFFAEGDAVGSAVGAAVAEPVGAALGAGPPMLSGQGTSRVSGGLPKIVSMHFPSGWRSICACGGGFGG